MADISDRLDRLQRREEFDRFGRPIRSVPAEPAGPMVTRPAGVDDRLGEVLDAVAAVVSRHPGLSVMVAVADGRAGRPVVRVTERDGGVETGVVVAGGRPAVAADPAAVPSASAPVRADFAGSAREPAYARVGTAREGGYGTVPPRDIVPQPVRETAYVHPPARESARAMPAGDPVFEAGGRPARVPSYRPPVRESGVPAGDPIFEPAARELATRDTVTRDTVTREAFARDAAARDAAARDTAAREGAARAAEARESAAREAAVREVNGRHAARHEERPGFSGSSWHNSLWSKDRAPGAPPQPEPAPPVTEPVRADDRPTIPVAEDTSQVVSRLAQLLRENPTLASSWSREAPE